MERNASLSRNPHCMLGMRSHSAFLKQEFLWSGGKTGTEVATLIPEFEKPFIDTVPSKQTWKVPRKPRLCVPRRSWWQSLWGNPLPAVPSFPQSSWISFDSRGLSSLFNWLAKLFSSSLGDKASAVIVCVRYVREQTFRGLSSLHF